VGDAWTVATPRPHFTALYRDALASLGTYPHAQVTLAQVAKQSTRMLKATCSACGYTVRLTHKWATKGLPLCPVDKINFSF
jgi:ribosomal protein L37E